MRKDQVNELLLQALETELGGVHIYESALECAVNRDLRREWAQSLARTMSHVQIVRGVFEKLGLDAERETSGRAIVRHVAEALVRAMDMAREGGTAESAQLVAVECVALAQTKVHLNWELIGEVAEASDPRRAEPLAAAQDEVEGQEAEHPGRSALWCRQLWIKFLGLPATLPPPDAASRLEIALRTPAARPHGAAPL